MYPKFEKLMNERGLTIFQVSKDTGIPNATLYEWKSGRSEPKIDKIYILVFIINNILTLRLPLTYV